jgi:hypothetical protein
MQVWFYGERALHKAWWSDFAKRFERGKLTFTGDVLQVISVICGQRKSGKVLKRFTIGA